MKLKSNRVHLQKRASKSVVSVKHFLSSALSCSGANEKKKKLDQLVAIRLRRSQWCHEDF